MKKIVFFLIMSLLILTIFGTEFIMLYPNGLAMKGDSVLVQSDTFQLDVPDTWVTDSFTSEPFPLAYKHVSNSSFSYTDELKKAIGNDIKWRFEDGTIKQYTLLLDDPLLLSDNNGVFSPKNGTAVFSEVNIEESRQYLDLSFPNYFKQLNYSYMFRNLSYNAFYVMNLDDEKEEAEIFGTILIRNSSNKDFETKNLHIFSGEINTLSTDYALKAMRTLSYEADMQNSGSTMENFNDYKIYSIPGSFSFEKGTAEYINFLNGRESYEKIYTYNTYYSNRNQDFEPLDQTIRIPELSRALMAGKIRIQKNDGNKVIFLGENNISNSSKGQLLEIQFGKAYDLQGKIELIQSNRSGNTYFEAYKFTAKNFSTEEKAIQLNFTLPRDSDVEVDVYSYSRPIATLLQIPLKLHPEMEAEVTFEIRYDR